MTITARDENPAEVGGLDLLPITCISSGPLVESFGHGVRVFDATHLDCPFVRALKEMKEVMQCVVADPCAGVKRDYRRARMDDVCGCLSRAGIKYRITD